LGTLNKIKLMLCLILTWVTESEVEHECSI
jgi:hypothetical protein